MTALPSAEIGVFGGSGFSSLDDTFERVEIDTPFGTPSAPAFVGELEGRSVAFLPRHGVDHRFPPHRVNFRANLWAMRELGVTRIVGPCAAGSLRPDLHPGELVICDQLIDRTSGRADTYADGPRVLHVSFADPYCPELRELAASAASAAGVTAHRTGTVVVISGPRFSTRAESRWFALMGGDLVNMTQYPEAYLARELGICYLGLALVTDYDAGVEGRDDIEAVTTAAILDVLRENADRTRAVLRALLPAIPPRGAGCSCAEALDSAAINP